MWVNFPARGLKFSEAYSLGEALPEDVKFLRQLWLDLGARFGAHPVTGQWQAEH